MIITFSTQWLPQSQIVRPDFPPRKAMEASTRDGLWSLWRRNVSTRPITPLLVFVFLPFLFHPFSFLFFFFFHEENSFSFSNGFYINQQPIIVSSAADEISGETVAIKMVTRIFAKATLAKRALRELALLRHFNNHENVTGLIDVDGIAETFNEM